MKLDRKWLLIGFGVGMLYAVYAYAATVDQIWQAVYDSNAQALRVTS